MSKEEHRFFFSSKYSIHNKNQGSFTVNLPFSLNLSGKWKCAILEVFVSTLDLKEVKSLYILADICETSLVGGNKQLPILKKLYLESDKTYYTSPNPFYITLKQSQINNFTLSCIDSNLEKITFNENFLLECNIHFYKYE